MWQNLTNLIGTTQILTKLKCERLTIKNCNCDKTQPNTVSQNLKKKLIKLKTQYVKKKKNNNTNCDKTGQIKMCHKSKCTKVKNSNYDKSQEIKLWQNSTQIVTKLTENNSEKKTKTKKNNQVVKNNW